MNDQQTHALNLLCETLVYGIFCVAITIVIYLLLTEKGLTLSRKALFCVAILQFSLASGHLATLVHEAYIPNDSIKVTQAAASMGQISEFIGACIIIWRVWHVWGRRWSIVIIPFLTSLAGLIAGMIFPAALTSRSQLTRILPIPSGAVALAGVIVNTLLIVGRLLYQQWQTKRVMGPAYLGSRTLRGVVLMMVESGAIIAAVYTAALVFEKRGSPVTHILLNTLEPLYGLNPTAIIILVHLNRAIGTHTTRQYTETLSAVRFGESSGRQRDITLDSATTESSAPAKLASRDPTGGTFPGKCNIPLDVGEKPFIEAYEFADNDGMV